MSSLTSTRIKQNPLNLFQLFADSLLAFRMSSGYRRVSTTFPMRFEAFREGQAEWAKEFFLLGRRFGDAAKTDFGARAGGQDDIGAVP
jgi:hypothetical protein